MYSGVFEGAQISFLSDNVFLEGKCKKIKDLAKRKIFIVNAKNCDDQKFNTIVPSKINLTSENLWLDNETLSAIITLIVRQKIIKPAKKKTTPTIKKRALSFNFAH